MKHGPLKGVCVIEIAGIGPAPCAGMMLADMGAEVILIGRRAANKNSDGILPGKDEYNHAIYNRGKKSIQIDLKKEEGVQLVMALVSNADILIEGFRPGVMEKLNLGPGVCLAENPGLIYGRMTGWGQTGPLSQAAGHEPNYMGLSGALWHAGKESMPPSAALTMVGDFGGGAMILAWGCLCAYINAQKTGVGQIVDAAISDGSAYLSSLLWVMYNLGQITDNKGEGWADGAAPWNDTYGCADDNYVTLCALEPKFYQELIERLELQDNLLFADQWNRQNWHDAKQELKTLFLTKTRDEWCLDLEGTDACFGPVLNFSEATKHPHNLARKTFLTMDGVVQPAPAPKLSVSSPTAGVPPEPGEHTVGILRELKMDADMIASLIEREVVGV